jgi:hypothetical protein
VLAGLRNDSDVTVDGIVCCVYLSVEKDSFSRVSVKLNGRFFFFIFCVIAYLTYVHHKYHALFYASLFSTSLT